MSRRLGMDTFDTPPPVPTTVARLETIITGERLMHGEPTTEDAAALVQAVMSAGTVARLDLVHGALMATYRAGRAAEQAHVEQLAQEHAAAFTAAVSRRAAEQVAQAAQPWMQQ